jgi:hypothetical protein
MVSSTAIERVTSMAKMHPSITIDRVAEACERQQTGLDNPGFCLACGEEAEGCEPDARNYECESCGEMKVFGAEELAMRLM